MITVIARSRFKAESLASVESVYRRLVDQTRTEQGCLRYELHRDLADPARLTMIEEWATEADLQAHLGSPAFAALVGELRPHVAAPTELERYTRLF